MTTIKNNCIRNKKRLYTAIACVFIFFAAGALAYAGGLPKWFPFSRRSALNEWKEKVFKGRVLYVVTEEKAAEETASVNNMFLLAQSRGACSGLVYEIRFSPISKPMVSWKWKIVSFPKKKVKDISETQWVEKDDFAARFYIIFPKLPFTHTECLEYVWDERLPEGTIKNSPYFKNIKLFVIRSGSAKLGEWVQEERNIYNDYKKAFGRAPECTVGAIAVMTDSDNTVSSAEACYDDIKVGYKKDEK